MTGPIADHYEAEIARLIEERNERIRLAADSVKLHLFAPGEWLCIDDGNEWPDDGARARLSRQIPERADLHAHMLRLWNRAVGELCVTDPDEKRAMYTRFVAWTEEPR